MRRLGRRRRRETRKKNRDDEAYPILAVGRDLHHWLDQILAVELVALGHVAVALVAHVVEWRNVGAVHRDVRIDADFGGQILLLDALLRLALDLLSS